MHSVSHALFELSRVSPWIAGACGLIAAVLAGLGKSRAAWKVALGVLALMVAMTLVAFAGGMSSSGHDVGYDFLGGALWFARAALVALAAPILVAVTVLVRGRSLAAPAASGDGDAG